jgi:acetyltransferase-like isoleucine patch superfamily enzyme
MSVAVLIDRYVNDSNETVRLQNRQDIQLEPGALIVNSSVRFGLYMERYSAINRSSAEGPCGVGSFAYVGDAQLGRYVHIGARSIVGGFEHPTNRLSISSVFWGQNLNILGVNASQDFQFRNLKPENQKTRLDADVWISANATVLSGLRIAVGTVVGAGSVVTHDTEPYGIYVGNPARLIRFRFNESLIGALIDSAWWELPPSVLLKLDMEDIEGCLEVVRAYRLATPN